LAPTILTLAPLIISSTDKLFFNAHKNSTEDCREWRLVCVAFQDSVFHYLSCLQDRCFLPEFYIAHPADTCYNTLNQRFWLQYQDCDAPTVSSMDAHLITPSNTSAGCMVHHQLVTVHSWVNLTHGDMHIHGQFNFAIVRGHKTCDCVRQDAWNALAEKQSMITNQTPRFDFPMYSIHVDRGIHTTYPGLIMALLVDTPLHPLHP
jgi:hypothetical protein